mgnify:CR=1 FL=1
MRPKAKRLELRGSNYAASKGLGSRVSLPAIRLCQHWQKTAPAATPLTSFGERGASHRSAKVASLHAHSAWDSEEGAQTTGCPAPDRPPQTPHAPPWRGGLTSPIHLNRTHRKGRSQDQLPQNPRRPTRRRPAVHHRQGEAGGKVNG